KRRLDLNIYKIRYWQRRALVAERCHREKRILNLEKVGINIDEIEMCPNWPGDIVISRKKTGAGVLRCRCAFWWQQYSSFRWYSTQLQRARHLGEATSCERWRASGPTSRIAPRVATSSYKALP